MNNAPVFMSMADGMRHNITFMNAALKTAKASAAPVTGPTETQSAAAQPPQATPSTFMFF